MTRAASSSTDDPQAEIVVWTYADANEFADHALELGGEGYRVAGQTSGKALTNGGSWSGAVGIVLVVIGLAANLLLVAIGVVLLLVGWFSRSTTYTVTYQR